MIKKSESPLEEPMNTLILGILKGFTLSMWRVSGEGMGGVTRAFGEDLWKLMKARSGAIGIEIDKSTPESCATAFMQFLVNIYESAGELDFTTTEDSIEFEVKNCELHDYSDFLDENNVPRSAGCPVALTGLAMMEDVTGNPFIIDNIDSHEGQCKIVLKIAE